MEAKYHWKFTFKAHTLHKAHRILKSPLIKNGIFAMDQNMITMFLMTDEAFLNALPLKGVQYEPLEEAQRESVLMYIIGLRPTLSETAWVATSRNEIDHWMIQHFYIKATPEFKAYIQTLYNRYKKYLPDIFDKDPYLLDYPALVWMRNFTHIT